MSFGGNIRIRPLTSLLLAGLLACVAPVSQALGAGPPCIEELVILTDAAQGAVCQNSYRPQNSDGLPAAMVLTARTSIDVNSPTDPNAPGFTGSVVLSSDGTGVRAANCGSGGQAIDGTGNGKDEEVIFTFDNPVHVDKILLSLNQIDFSADEPVIFISGNDGIDYVIEEPEIIAAFTTTGPFRGTVDFGALVTVPAGLLSSEFKIRETESHTFVDEITVLCFCLSAGDCDDADLCTDDDCDLVSGTCQNIPIDVPTVCDDGNACTTESCDPAMGCVNTPDCVLDTDCTDNDACTTDTCSPQGCCVFTSIDVPTVCDDGDACTTETCDPVEGCVNTPIDVPTVCDDGNACTTESCDPALGCVNTPDCVLDTDCTDNDACTTDTCSPQGCCVFTPIDVPTVCDDSDACTTDTCDPVVGCENVLIDVPTVCDDGNVCTTESCDPAMGCVNTPDCVLDTDCNDSDACTTDTCSVEGCCVFTQIDVPTVCDDGDACTAESCDPVIGCVNTPECVLDSDCEDGDACTIDSCGADGCCWNVVDGFTVGGAIYTDLDSPITSGLEGVSVCVSCDCGFSACDMTAGPWGGWDLAGVPAGNCSVMPTLPGWCFSHVEGGEAGNPAPIAIAVDEAHQAQNLSLQFLATQGTNFCCLVNADCDDGDACTLDECSANTCTNTPIDVPGACDDSDACTIDICDPLIGCVNTAVDPSVFCNDDDACTIDDCDPAAGCMNTPVNPQIFCDDNDACTVESCDPVVGCVNTLIDVPSVCGDADECTIDTCEPEVGCVNTPIGPDGCDDGIVCTADLCDPVLGCQWVTDSSLCDDGDACTADVCDPVLDCTNLNLCEADLNCNGAVGASDLGGLLGAWGTDPGGPPDFNLDGTVDAFDLGTLLGAWGPCPLVPGACCGLEGTSVCQQLTEQKCTQAGGVFLGEATSCAECSCGPGAGDCCSANGTAGCEEINCCDQVCDVLPSCCEVAWTSECSDQASATCGALCFTTPVNDHCADAIPIFDGDTDYATFFADTDGPAHADCEFDGQTYHDIWYDYIATCNQNLTVSTCNQAAYDTDLVVYDGCACPVSDENLLACDDDAGGDCDFTSEVTVPVDNGNCYKIRIGGWNDSSEGTGTLTLTCGL